jgi:hypothetical protein
MATKTEIAPQGRHQEEAQHFPSLERPPNLRWLWIVVVVVLVSQFCIVAGYSLLQYNRFDLSIDFSTADQATWLILHGHLDPWSTTHSYAYIDDHFALITWPLAVLYWVYPHGVLLLWIQDAAGVLTELVVVVWIVEICRRQLKPQWVGKGCWWFTVGALIVMVTNYWFYQAMFFDFHTEAFAALFLTLTLRAAWNGKMMYAVGWAIPLLLCGNLGGVYLAALGLTLLLAIPRQWWWGVGALVVGYGWIRFADLMGASRNGILNWYSYLQTGNPAVRVNVTPVSLVKSILVHPMRSLQVVWERRSLLYQNLIPTGVIGLFSPWSAGIAVVVLLSSALIYPLVFLDSGFQNLPAYFVTLGGTVLVLCSLIRIGRRGARVAAFVLGAAIVVQSVIYGGAQIPHLASKWITVSPAQAEVLQRALDKTPENAEVIAEWGVEGRFSERQWIYNFNLMPQSFPVNSSTVEFVVVPYQWTGDEPLAQPQAEEALQYLTKTLHTHPLSVGHGIYVLSWHPTPHQKTLTIPASSSR